MDSNWTNEEKKKRFYLKISDQKAKTPTHLKFKPNFKSVY